MVKTKKAIASSYANPSLIMWGILWIIAYTITHFYYIYAFYIFMSMAVVGGVGTAVIVGIFRSKAPIREVSSQKYGRRVTALWIFLCIYIVVWLFLLTPFTGIQCNAFICTVAMFAYIIMGLWFESRFMIVLGLVVTGATLIGFYHMREYYCLWMAFVGGGTLFGTGMYIRLRWR
jgi:hypothetical protein